MITEDYVSFETAKLLKEKGFDEPVLKFYDHKGEVAELYYRPQNKSLTGDTYKCPTTQMAMKWLREVHNIVIVPTPRAFTVGGEVATWVYNIWRGDMREVSSDFFIEEEVDSYEEAIEAAIKYCLENLI